MEKTNRVLLAAACFFAGIILGFLFSPVKKGIYCGNYSGNSYGKNLPVDGCCCDDGDDLAF